MEHIDEAYQSLIDTKLDCMNYGGDWLVKDSNFDDIVQAMLTMFKCSITEGWLDIMIWGVGARGTPYDEKIIVPGFNPIW